ncbi:MAG: hypothetical protein ACRD0Z_00580 [Acidimicrobiales bacterium]
MAARARRIRNNEGATVREVARPAWSPAQIVAVVGGLLLLVMGAVGLAHTGFAFTNIPITRTAVAGLGMTSLAAVVQTVAGVIVLVGASSPTAAKAVTSVMGVIILAWGLIVAFDPSAFLRYWGYDGSNGVYYIVVGAALFILTALSPIFMSRRNVVVRDATTSAESVTATGSPTTTY